MIVRREKTQVHEIEAKRKKKKNSHLHIYNMVFYIENVKEPADNLIRLIRELL